MLSALHAGRQDRQLLHSNFKVLPGIAHETCFDVQYTTVKLRNTYAAAVTVKQIVIHGLTLWCRLQNNHHNKVMWATTPVIQLTKGTALQC